MVNTDFVMDSEFYCTQCGHKGIPIVRRKGREREAGHLKKLFCMHCKEETNHAECRLNTKYDFENFKLEYEYGNFSDKGDRVRPYNKLEEMIRNGEVERIKTLAISGNTRSWKDDLDS